MQALFSRRVGLQLLAVVFGFFIMACKAGAGGGGGGGGGGEATGIKRWEGQTVYSRVGMRVEPTRKGTGWHMYSTSFIALQKHIPAGTKFTAQNVGRNKIQLVAEDSSVVQVEFAPKHHQDLTFDSWLDREISTTPVELPSDLNSSERTAIREGKYEVGMSRAALFLSIGYPPTTRSPNINDTVLVYERKRFMSAIAFTFDAQGRISNIK